MAGDVRIEHAERKVNQGERRGRDSCFRFPAACTPCRTCCHRAPATFWFAPAGAGASRQRGPASNRASWAGFADCAGASRRWLLEWLRAYLYDDAGRPYNRGTRRVKLFTEESLRRPDRQRSHQGEVHEAGALKHVGGRDLGVCRRRTGDRSLRSIAPIDCHPLHGRNRGLSGVPCSLKG
jgi:hypothetical protein